VSVATFLCDVDDCTFEGNCSKSLKKHKLTHSAALLHCDFMGCSYETKNSSNLKRHKLNHTTTVAAAAALLHCDFMGCSYETKDSSNLKRHKLKHTTTVAAAAALLHCDFMGCSYETKDSSILKRHKLSHTTTVAAAVALLHCDFMGCSYETEDSSNFKRHKLNHTTTVAAAAALLHCDFMGCSYETKDSSNLKRHKLSHTEKAQKEIAKEKVKMKAAIEAEKSRACEDGIGALTVEQINTPSPPKKQRLSIQIPIHGSFEGSRNASIDAGIQKASEFFSSPNVTRATCACCNELLQNAKNIRVMKAEGQWLERLKNRLTWDHTAHVIWVFAIAPELITMHLKQHLI
jgi:hypothetical protein